jgi:Txe/YoeB family toxin of toxin-antitoxin system
MAWRIVFTKKAQKDLQTAIQSGYGKRIKELLTLIEADPLSPYPPYEMLLGDLKGACSRLINMQHRLVYSIHPKENTVKIISMWTHYE